MNFELSEKRVLLICEEIASQPGIKELENNNNNQITFVNKREKHSNIIKRIKREKSKDIHLICHGNENKLFLGNGIDIKALIKLQNNRTNPRKIVLWACNAGKKIDQNLAKTKKVIASGEKLGCGKSIEGHDDITLAVHQLPFELDTPIWTSEN
ncbi:hypothetical protein [Prochlorococcus marinus]|uniref:hypothetical protein n=1 Tax=Prochlorococcus marinus TaxID=1219 RepID=UPI0018C867B9|nr:hypothetical protein [Prochlorococcus marinus]